jgi:amidase
MTLLGPAARSVAERTAVVTREQFVWSFDADAHPVITVDPGAVLRIETNDCFHGQVRTEADVPGTYDTGLVNAATGPIEVRGARVGDTLAVELLEISPGPRGVAVLTPGQGQLGHLIPRPTTRILEVDGATVRLGPAIAFPARPMIGVIGVAPAHGSAPTLDAGPHGGNLDDNLNGPGATVLLPIRRPGAMLSIGDMHAAMGDGEICGSGVEVEGEALIRVDVLPARQSHWPVTVLADSWVTHGTAVEDLTEAVDAACQEAGRLLVDEWGFSVEDAFVFLSVACDVGIAQAVHPCPGTVIARVRVPRIAACPTPFRPR